LCKTQEKRRAANEAPVDPKFLQKYAIDDDDNGIEKALKSAKVSASGVISVKSNKTKADSTRRWADPRGKELMAADPS
jgi:N-acetyltransferase 10